MQTQTTKAATPGFADPVHDAQRVFRALLEAMARPGTIQPLPAAPGEAPGLCPAAAAVLLALADLDTPLWLDAAAGGDAARNYLRFFCGSPITEDPGRAAFAVIGDGARLPDLSGFSLGSPAYPDRSTTLIVRVGSLAEGGDGGWTLTGPGVDGARRLRVAGLDPAFVQDRAALGELFPMGLDAVLVTDGALACLPRSVRIEEGPCT